MVLYLYNLHCHHQVLTPHHIGNPRGWAISHINTPKANSCKFLYLCTCVLESLDYWIILVLRWKNYHLRMRLRVKLIMACPDMCTHVQCYGMQFQGKSTQVYMLKLVQDAHYRWMDTIIMAINWFTYLAPTPLSLHSNAPTLMLSIYVVYGN